MMKRTLAGLIRRPLAALLLIIGLSNVPHLSSGDNTCDFENPSECSWYFTNSLELARILKAQRASPASAIPQQRQLSPKSFDEDSTKENNFYVVVSGGSNISNHYAYFLSRKPSDHVAMIVTPFYESTSSKCELAFRHRILGETGAELIVTAEQLTLSHAHTVGNEAEDDDWVRPTLRASFAPIPNSIEPWITSQVPIGTFDYPTRIRVECHASDEGDPEADLNVECHVDDLQLINCEEKIYETELCNNYDSSNPKYACRSGGHNVCLSYEALCDMHAECDNDDDENDELHSCLSLPLGARCNFEDAREPAGCTGWRFLSGHSSNASNDRTHLVSIASSDGRVNAGKFIGLPPNEYFYRGNVYRPGRFLFFSTYNYATTNEHEIVYTSAVSPRFPPILTNSSDEMPACMIRFFYCQIGSNPFQIFVASDQRPGEPKPLWSPPKDVTSATHCEWKKGVAPIRPVIDTDTDYFLKLSFVKIPGSVGSIAIDDLTLTPSCLKHFPNWRPRVVTAETERVRLAKKCVGNAKRLSDGRCPDVTEIGKNDFTIGQLSLGHVIAIILIFNVFVFLLVLAICCVWRRVIQASAKDIFHIDEHEMMRMSGTSSTVGISDGALSRCVSNRISGNPIYETLQINNLPRISRHNLQKKRIIGHGAFGEVYEAYYFRAGQRMSVALKSLQTEPCKDIIDDFEMEAQLLSQFKHENIVMFYGVSFEQQPRYIVLEYLKGGDLRNFLRENRPKFGSGGGTPFLLEESTVRMADLVGFALDVAKACEHLETTKFVHRDIAARNCLLVSKTAGERIVKIADFGMARDIYRNDYYRKGGKAFLPVRWMPPEAFLDGVFTTKTDVWAFGVLLWEIFSMGYVPYSGRDNHEVMKLVVAGDRLDPPVGILREIYDVMMMCWNTDAEKRPKFLNLVSFFNDFMTHGDVLNEPIPPIRHRLLAGRLSVTPSTVAESLPIGEMIDLTAGVQSDAKETRNSTTVSSATVSSQATTTTTLPTSICQNGGNSQTTGGADVASATSYDSMPTVGDGVSRNVFPPYESKLVDTLISMDGYTRHGSRSFDDGNEDPAGPTRPPERTKNNADSSASSSASTNDDSTLHGSVTSSLRYQVRNVPPPPILARYAVPQPQQPPVARQAVATLAPRVMPQSAPSWRRPFAGAGQDLSHSLPDSPVDLTAVRRPSLRRETLQIMTTANSPPV